MFNYFKFIQTLVSFSPRQFFGETKTAHFIISLLEKYQVPFYLQRFSLQLPLIKKAVLKADGKILACAGCCYVGGKIIGKDKIISSLLSSIICQTESNINFNPKCPAVSPGNHYFAPAVAVTHKGLVKILKAKDVQGKVIVRSVRHQAANILVGNQKNPRYVCFAHYDSIKKGALDNASGVSVLMGTILASPCTLKNTLYVFSACEELSYEKPIYRGYGYRIFEKQYHHLLKQVKKVIVLECVGDGPVQILDDPKMIELGFPIKDLTKLMDKIRVVTGDFEHCMTIYHSDLDDGRGLKKKFLQETQSALLEEMRA